MKLIPGCIYTFFSNNYRTVFRYLKTESKRIISDNSVTINTLTNDCSGFSLNLQSTQCHENDTITPANGNDVKKFFEHVEKCTISDLKRNHLYSLYLPGIGRYVFKFDYISGDMVYSQSYVYQSIDMSNDNISIRDCNLSLFNDYSITKATSEETAIFNEAFNTKITKIYSLI